MKLNTIAFNKDGFQYTVEENAGGSYSIDVSTQNENGRYDSVTHFRTDELPLESLIEALQFIQNYNFIQEK